MTSFMIRQTSMILPMTNGQMSQVWQRKECMQGDHIKITEKIKLVSQRPFCSKISLKLPNNILVLFRSKIQFKLSFWPKACHKMIITPILHIRSGAESSC